MRLELYNYKNQWKFMLLGVAVLIAIGTLWYTESFLKELRAEEAKRAKIWAEAMKIMINADDAQLVLALQVVNQNTTIPIIWTDKDTNIIQDRNIRVPKIGRDDFLKRELRRMASENEAIVVKIPDGDHHLLFFRDSSILTQLRIYPMILLGVIGLFIMVAYMAFSNVRRSEQNRVWTGMAKETAHQIGTPLSSLMGWIEILRTKDTDESVLSEMEKDIGRLETITERFSKIGSQPKLILANIGEVTENALSYMNRRSSSRISIAFHNELPAPIIIPVNVQLYGWVIENMVRNAIDAIEGKGSIEVTLTEVSNKIQVDIQDTGKGISQRMTKAIFRPGFTTKTRGWGLGLSLAKRIIEEYHDGKIFVLKSVMGKGTTFRVVLPISPKS